jgi:hypothetical protein
MWMRRDEYEEQGHLKKVTDSIKSLNMVYS